MFLIFAAFALSAEEEFLNSNSVAVNIPSGTEYVAKFPLANCFVIVDSYKDFNAVAYDYNNNVLGTFSSSKRIINFEEAHGKIVVKPTGSATTFYFSVLVFSNLPLDSRCSSIVVSNTATKTYNLAVSGETRCLWVSSSSSMKVKVSSNMNGITKIFTPASYSAIKTIQNSGTETVTTQNPLIIAKPSSGSNGIVTVETSGDQISGIEQYSLEFTPSANPNPHPPIDPTVPPSQPTTKPTPCPDPSNQPQPSGKTNAPVVDPTDCPDGQGQGEGDKTKDKTRIGIIVALVIVTILFVAVTITVVFVYYKFRTVLKVL